MAKIFESNGLLPTIDTDSLLANDRTKYWQDIGSKLYVSHTPHIDISAEFSARTQFASTNGYDVSAVQMRGATLERNAYHVRRDESERCFFCQVTEGDISFVEEDKLIKPRIGEIFLIDTCRPYKIIYNEASCLLHFTVTRNEIEKRLGNTRRFTSVLARTSDPIADVASELMRKTASSLNFSGELAEARTLETTVDLMAMSLSRAADAIGACLSTNTDIVLERLEHAIRRQLHNVAIDTTSLAKEAGVSVRYANKLLAKRGTSLMRHVQALRLTQAARQLEDPLCQFRSITDIALSLGFADMSHFSRVFKNRYDLSPRDYRARALQQRGVSRGEDFDGRSILA